METRNDAFFSLSLRLPFCHNLFCAVNFWCEVGSPRQLLSIVCAIVKKENQNEQKYGTVNKVSLWRNKKGGTSSVYLGVLLDQFFFFICFAFLFHLLFRRVLFFLLLTSSVSLTSKRRTDRRERVQISTHTHTFNAVWTRIHHCIDEWFL